MLACGDWKNLIWGSFNQVPLPDYRYAYLHSHACAMQIWPYSTHISSSQHQYRWLVDTVLYKLPVLQSDYNQHCRPQPTQQLIGFITWQSILDYLIPKSSSLFFLFVFVFIFVFAFYRHIGLEGRVFTNGPGDLGSIPGRVIPKTLKMVLDTSLFSSQQY